MNRNTIIIGCLTAFCCSNVIAETNVPAIAWGKATNGLQAGIAYRSVTNNEKAYARVTLCLRNAERKPIRVLKLTAQARFWGHLLPLEIRQGRTVLKYQGAVIEPPPPPDDSEYIVLNPGDTDSVDVSPVAQNWGVTAADEVDATFVFRSAAAEDKELWVGETQSGTIKIKMSSQPPPGN